MNLAQKRQVMMEERARQHLQPRRDEKEQGNRVAPGTRNGRGWDLMVVIATVMVMVTTDTRSARQRCGARGWQTGRDSCCGGGGRRTGEV